MLHKAEGRNWERDEREWRHDRRRSEIRERGKSPGNLVVPSLQRAKRFPLRPCRDRQDCFPLSLPQWGDLARMILPRFDGQAVKPLSSYKFLKYR